MKKLWAPWRDKYITQTLKKDKGCIFCQILSQNKDKKNFIFARFKYCFAVLNIYPYNNGHVLVMPYRHVNDLSKLNKEESAELLDLLNYTKSLLDELLAPQGYNIGLNIGKAAGAGVPGHIHFHVVPRWKGDVNFMPVVNDTKVVSQSLSALYDHLIKAQDTKD